MKTSRSNKQQSLFADQEQYVCACGCGQIGFRNKRGRKRLYINETHKKRVSRRKAAAERPEYFSALTKAGLQVAARITGLSYPEKWITLTNDQQHALYLLDQHPRGFHAGVAAMISLLPFASGYVERRAVESETPHDDNHE